MTQPKFDFVAFEAKVAAASRGESAGGSSRWQRIWVLALVAGLLIAMAAPKVLPSSMAQSVIVLIGLVLEVAGIIGVVILQVRELFPMLRNRHVQFAHELDIDYVSYVEIVSWLRSCDNAKLQPHLVYLRGRRDTMQKKLGLFTGGVERLGVLPLLVAVYIQVRGMASPLHVSYFEGLIAFMLILAYLVGWLAVGNKQRMDLYECLLSDALADQAKA